MIVDDDDMPRVPTRDGGSTGRQRHRIGRLMVLRVDDEPLAGPVSDGPYRADALVRAVHYFDLHADQLGAGLQRRTEEELLWADEEVNVLDHRAHDVYQHEQLVYRDRNVNRGD